MTSRKRKIQELDNDPGTNSDTNLHSHDDQHNHPAEPPNLRRSASSYLLPANLSSLSSLPRRFVRSLTSTTPRTTRTPPGQIHGSAPQLWGSKMADKTATEAGGEASKGGSYFPWSAIRSSTPNPLSEEEKSKLAPGGDAAGSLMRSVGDHTRSRINRLSRRKYPADCPPLVAQWYHAVDIPKRKPFTIATSKDTQPVQEPKKYSPFSEGDSKAIEAAFQKLADQDDERGRSKLKKDAKDKDNHGNDPNMSLDQEGSGPSGTIKVSVNEDYLFDVDVEMRELGPAYWLGPVYDVRRGTWFYAESAGLRPCDENLATQLEEGFLKIQPWKLPILASRSGSLPRRPASVLQDSRNDSTPRPSTPQNTVEVEKDKADTVAKEAQSTPPQPSARSFRLFGSHMSSVVTYEDATTAYIMTEGYITAMSGTLYERFSGGAHYAGTKVVRGYTEQAKKISAEEKKAPEAAAPLPQVEEVVGSPTENGSQDIPESERKNPRRTRKETPRQALERKMSQFASLDAADEEEEVRKRDEEEIMDDYNEDDDHQQGREIEHLILITHGIGQRMGMRLESINFIHDVNTMRKTLKSVYKESADLQALNGEVDKEVKNCRVQILPIVWRHLLDFPRQSLKHNRMEHDMGDGEGFPDDEYPSLEDITVDGVPVIRNLIADLGLDILLYQSQVYKPHITRIVLEEANRLYKLFKDRNPGFKGKVSFIGHSLGSAVLFDILCHQNIDPSSPLLTKASKNEPRIQLDFEVEDFYALGSPIGLFQMLKGRSIAARQTPNVKPAQTPYGLSVDPFSRTSSYFEVTTSSPYCKQIFNIFHPSDPVSYRLEPFISKTMASLPPQPLPYTKKGIFGAPAGQGFTGIGARVGQSVSGLWSSFSTGLTNSLINRTLGLSAEIANRPMPTLSNPDTAPLSVEDAKRLVAQGSNSLETGSNGRNPPTLLDTGLETLFSGFQVKAAKAGTPLDGPQVKMEEGKVKREEGKVRALNKNGRVDYCIQEGAFDISLLASMASHLAYFGDEDVSHFLISQLLSRQRIMKEATTEKSQMH